MAAACTRAYGPAPAPALAGPRTTARPRPGTTAAARRSCGCAAPHEPPGHAEPVVREQPYPRVGGERERAGQQQELLGAADRKARKPGKPWRHHRSPNVIRPAHFAFGTPGAAGTMIRAGWPWSGDSSSPLTYRRERSASGRAAPGRRRLARHVRRGRTRRDRRRGRRSARPCLVTPRLRGTGQLARRAVPAPPSVAPAACGWHPGRRVLAAVGGVGCRVAPRAQGAVRRTARPWWAGAPRGRRRPGRYRSSGLPHVADWWAAQPPAGHALRPGRGRIRPTAVSKGHTHRPVGARQRAWQRSAGLRRTGAVRSLAARLDAPDRCGETGTGRRPPGRPCGRDPAPGRERGGDGPARQRVTPVAAPGLRVALPLPRGPGSSPSSRLCSNRGDPHEQRGPPSAPGSPPRHCSPCSSTICCSPDGDRFRGGSSPRP
ncbi:hypothetical protein SHIRM173S_00524 [Streptomyces hirsutus]